MCCNFVDKRKHAAPWDIAKYILPEADPNLWINVIHISQGNNHVGMGPSGIMN